MNQREKEDHVLTLFAPGKVFDRNDLIEKTGWAEQQIRTTLRHLVCEGRIEYVSGGRANGLARYTANAA